MTATHITKARALAKLLHAGHTDKAGDDYFAGHLTRVASAGDFYIDVSVGYLHDIVEDTDATLDDLRDLDFGDHIVGAVDLLTKKDGVTYADYIRAIKASGDSVAVRVKLADLRDHLRDTSAISDSLVKRYTDALAVLS
jgi:(p)ppGpp synthase/HD superfamily hydrolase